MGIITRQFNYVAGRTIRASEVNKNENTLYDEINGNIEDVNITAESLTARVMADDVNPLLRDAEKYENFIVNGLETTDISSGSTAQVAVSAGISYTIHNDKMYRAINSSTQNYTLTNTDNGTYYLHISYQGILSDTLSIDGGDGSQVIAKLEVTGQPSNPAITVTDQRNTKLFFVATHYLDGCFLSYIDSNSILVSAGVAEIGNRKIFNTSSQTLDITVDSNYMGSETAIGASQWCYVYVAPISSSAVWEAKLSVNPPQYTDTQNNTNGIARYRKEGSVYYRCIGAVYNDSLGNIIPFHQNDSFIQYGKMRDVSAGTAVSANMPAISQRGYFELFVSTDTDLKVTKIRVAGSNDEFIQLRSGTPNSSGSDKTTAYVSCFTNASQQVEVGIDAGGSCKTLGYWLNIR